MSGLARTNGFDSPIIEQMPANNLLLVFRRLPKTSSRARSNRDQKEKGSCWLPLPMPGTYQSVRGNRISVEEVDHGPLQGALNLLWRLSKLLGESYGPSACLLAAPTQMPLPPIRVSRHTGYFANLGVRKKMFKRTFIAQREPPNGAGNFLRIHCAGSAV